ncbi:MAG: hypothetical protein V3V86_06940, partial [Gammaproteobacteria bacterium]
MPAAFRLDRCVNRVAPANELVKSEGKNRKSSVRIVRTSIAREQLTADRLVAALFGDSGQPAELRRCSFWA